MMASQPHVSTGWLTFPKQPFPRQRADTALLIHSPLLSMPPLLPILPAPLPCPHLLQAGIKTEGTAELILQRR